MREREYIPNFTKNCSRESKNQFNGKRNRRRREILRGGILNDRETRRRTIFQEHKRQECEQSILSVESASAVNGSMRSNILTSLPIQSATAFEPAFTGRVSSYARAKLMPPG